MISRRANVTRWSRGWSGALAFLVFGGVASADTAAVGLAYDAVALGGRCPDSGEFQREVVELLGRDPFSASATRLLRVEVHRATTGLVGSVVLVSAQGQELGRRDLAPADATCTEVSSALAMAAVLALDPMQAMLRPAPARTLPAVVVSPSAPEPHADEGVVPAPIPDVPAVSVASAPAAPGEVALSLASGPTVGLGPGLLWHLGLGVDGGTRPWRWAGELVARGGPAVALVRGTVDTSSFDADVAFGRALGPLEASATVLAHRVTFGPSGWVPVDAGASWSAAAGLRLAWALALDERFSLLVRLDAWADVRRWRVVEIPSRDVLWSSSPFAASCSLGLRWGFRRWP